MSSDGEYSVSSDEVSSEQLFGSCKTQLRWCPDSNSLLLNVRQLLETRRGLEFKYKGSVHTGTGAYRYRSQLRKAFFTNTPSVARIMAADRGVQLKGDGEGEKIDAGRLLPAGAAGLLWRDWSIAPGIAVSSDAGAGFCYTLGFRKQPQIVKRTGQFDSWLACKGTLEFDPHLQRVGAFGNARLKLFRFGITTSQDARLSIGWDWRLAQAAAGSGGGGGGDGGEAEEVGGGGLSFFKTPYLKLAENDWAVRWHGNSVSFSYLI